MKEKFLTQGNIALLAITLVVTILTAAVCNMLGADRLTTLLTAPMGGILGLLGVGALFEVADLKAPMGPEPGILGIVLGSIASMIIF